MNDGFFGAITVVLILIVVMFFAQYQACVAKFPDAPAWACMVRP